jgi:uncharacterized protein YkwD
LLSNSLYACSNENVFPNREQDISSLQQDQSKNTLDNDNINNPDYDKSNDNIDDKTLNVLGTQILLGESVNSVLDKLGSPNRIAKTEMDFEYYVYNNNYSKLLFVAIKDNKVVGYYTDSIDFNYLGITSGCSLDKVNKSLKLDFSMDYVLNHTTDAYILHIFIDDIGSQLVTGISVFASDLKVNGYTNEAIRDIELLVYDLTNSIRKRNGIPILSWSSTATKAARKHSVDMAQKRYFDHYNLYNKNPGDRLNEEGIYYQYMSENIIAGYGTAIISSHAWFNSLEHRDNILNKGYMNLGVGFTYQEESVYKTYITQTFYR